MSEQSEAMPYRRAAWQVGDRTLVAKTCPRCCRFLAAEQFFRRGKRRGTYCRTCKCRAIREAPSQRDAVGRRRQMLASRQVIQDFTRIHAHRHGEPWVESDHAVLSDPRLTLVEKALRLQRTYIAVINLVTEHKYTSKPVVLYADEIERLASALSHEPAA